MIIHADSDAQISACLEGFAREQGCSVIHLDSGTQRHAAHRFYHRQGYSIQAYHLLKKLD